jgi:hypothetical protein
MKPDENEVKIKGGWKSIGKQVLPDENCVRIDWLKSKYFHKIAVDPSGWDTLFRDPEDGRYWELTYPESELHGGGASQLTVISFQVAKVKYNIE